MADSNPFAHLGQGMLGGDAAIARAAAAPLPLFVSGEKGGLRFNPNMPIAGGLAAMALNSLFGKKPDQEQDIQNGVAPPVVGGTGVNPMLMGSAPPGGVGLQNEAPVQGLQPRG